MYLLSSLRPRPDGRCSPGVSTSTSCPCGRLRTPRMRLRVVCGRGEMIAIFCPSRRFSSVDRKKSKAENAPTGMATAGLVVGIISLVLGCLIFAACALCMKMGAEMNREMQKQAETDPQLRKQLDDFNRALKEGDKATPP